MINICPTVTAFELHEYRRQMEAVVGFTERVHIDLMDGTFAPSVSPALNQIWWPHTVIADIHLMYEKPMDFVFDIIRLKPNLVIIHAESDTAHMQFAAEMHKHDIKAGLALLQSTNVSDFEQIIHSFDQVLIFSGNLGFHGGTANLELLDKVKEVQHIHPNAEIAWDGGITSANAQQLIDGGVDVLNVGGFIQNSSNPERAYAKLKTLVENRDEKQ